MNLVLKRYLCLAIPFSAYKIGKSRNREDNANANENFTGEYKFTLSELLKLGDYSKPFISPNVGELLKK